MDTYSLNIDSQHHRTRFHNVAQHLDAPVNQSMEIIATFRNGFNDE